jgi:hypothetical protein
MKKVLSFFLIALSCICTNAQNAEALIKAERDFEQSCLQHGIRDGFLAWVDPDGIAFTENGPSNAKQFWASLPAFDGVFSWSPSYAEMSISGDWGYTTGNYVHRAKSLQDTVNQAGQYTTVWHKTDKWVWKWLVDIGNNHKPLQPENQAKTISIEKFKATRYADSSGLAELEKTFIAAFEKNTGDAYHRFASTTYILNLGGYLPVISADSALALVNRIPSSLLYHPSGVFISSGGDMGAVFGRISCSDKTGSYLRIWRFEKGGWKIALEVIRL